MRTITKAFFALMGVMILVSCSQTKDLTTSTTPEPRYHKVYYKNKIIYKDHQRKGEDLKLEIDDSKLADLEQYERPEVIIPLESPKEVQAPEERELTASRDQKSLVRMIPFTSLSGAFKMMKAIAKTDVNNPAEGEYDFGGSLALKLIILGLLFYIIGIIFAYAVDPPIGNIFYAIGSILLIVGLVLLIIDLVA